MRKKILLVEDNKDLLELLRLNLKEAGFAVTTTTNGLDALRKAAALRPDLIVLDLMLPELDGFEVCETLRKMPETVGTPILILSGLSSHFARLTGLESGGTDFITKPASPDALVTKIKAMLSTSGQAVPTEDVTA